MSKNNLRESLASVLAVHKQANWDKNLGQYKSEHKCQCGFTFVSDGHNPADFGATGHMDDHITEQLLAVFKEGEWRYKRDLHDRLEVTASMLFTSYEKLADLENELEGKYI